MTPEKGMSSENDSSSFSVPVVGASLQHLRKIDLHLPAASTEMRLAAAPDVRERAQVAID
jgi:hypothetical protein